MTQNSKITRETPIDLSSDQFRSIGYQLVDQIADLWENIGSNPVTPGEDAKTVQSTLGAADLLPDSGSDPEAVMKRATDLLMNHSLFNGHPRFWGYITAPAAPIGILGDLLASGINQNVGGWALSPMATEIEAQTVGWISELVGFSGKGGLMVSGGNMANFVCFLVASRNKTSKEVRAKGISGSSYLTYCSSETHTWVQKAADLFGFGTDSIRWIPIDSQQQMDMGALRSQIKQDQMDGHRPFLLIGTAGTVSTGAIDPLDEMASIAKENDLWYHIDGAYGGFAAISDLVGEQLVSIDRADSIAVDPHKWLYAPLEAGCALVRDPEHLRDAFSYHPPYYQFDNDVINYFDYGFQNSRGFRALKVWLAIQQVGRAGYVKMINDDIDLTRQLHQLLGECHEIQRFTCQLSISTFRYVPPELRSRLDEAPVKEYLNKLNSELLATIQESGEAFLSNAVIGGIFALRACIVNFRTTVEDIMALPEIVIRLGGQVDHKLRSPEL